MNFIFIFILLLICLIFYFKFKHITINFKSLKYRKAKVVDDRFGVYLITGKQGSNKTYYSIQLAYNQDRRLVKYIKTNIHSLKIPDYQIQYFTKIDEIYTDTDTNVIYIIDEVSRKWKKNSPCDTQFYAWLNQCRKRNRVCILITQEYKELPMWIRRPAKYMLNSYTIPFFTRFFNIFALNVGDGYNLCFDKDEGEYICPNLKTILYKRNRFICSMYDTFEPINEL